MINTLFDEVRFWRWPFGTCVNTARIQKPQLDVTAEKNSFVSNERRNNYRVLEIQHTQTPYGTELGPYTQTLEIIESLLSIIPVATNKKHEFIFAYNLPSFECGPKHARRYIIWKPVLPRQSWKDSDYRAKSWW